MTQYTDNWTRVNVPYPGWSHEQSVWCWENVGPRLNVWILQEGWIGGHICSFKEEVDAVAFKLRFGL